VKDRLHVFRRTFAANAVRQGIPNQYIMAVAGWDDEQMTLRYTRAMIAEEQALQAFQEGFSPFGR
jgi:integrase